MEFQVEGIFKVTGRGYFVVVVCLEKDFDFSLTENSKLGNIEIKSSMVFTKPRDENGNVRMNAFTFVLKNDADFEKLKVGDIVILTNEI